MGFRIYQQLLTEVCSPVCIFVSLVEPSRSPQVISDHIAHRYEVLHVFGQSTYEQVFKSLDHKTSEVVAMKFI